MFFVVVAAYFNACLTLNLLKFAPASWLRTTGLETTTIWFIKNPVTCILHLQHTFKITEVLVFENVILSIASHGFIRNGYLFLYLLWAGQHQIYNVGFDSSPIRIRDFVWLILNLKRTYTHPH